MSDEEEKAWAEYAVGDEHGPGPVTYRGAFMAGRASVRDNFSSLRSRIGALEAVIASVGELADKAEHGALRWADPLPVPEWVERVRAIITLAPSVVLDQMIREAKAEAVETARDAIMPPVNWNLRPDGTEMPGTQHIDEALHDMHVQLSAVAAEYRNEGR